MTDAVLQRGGAWTTLAAILGAVAVLAGCAALPPAAPARAVATLPDRPFAAEGRLSARHQNDAVSANFRWTHAPPRDDLGLITPLGQIVAELAGDTSVPYARVRLSDGNAMEAEDFATLTQRALGFPLPVTGLSAWIRGGPHAGSSFTAETDDAGRVALLRQDGWEIVFDYKADATPARLRMSYPGVEVRVVVDRLE